MKKLNNPFAGMTKFEWALWGCSVVVVLVCSFFSKEKSVLSVITSLVGVTGLIFVAKGNVWGQITTCIFSVMYAIVSWENKYYGEMITYVGMTMPIALLSIVSWLKNPYKQTAEVKVNRIGGREWIAAILLTIGVTIAFYFILRALGTAQLWLSTFSVTTSFLASYLMFRRASFYAIAYSANDLVLIGLWVLASVQDISYLCMAVCFLVFLANDIYGFISWTRRGKRQEEESAS